MKEIYPVVASYLHKRLEAIKNPAARCFLDSQPGNVLDLLRWEGRKFKDSNPTRDPIQKDFIPTNHPKIVFIVPKGFRGGREGMTPNFYACPHCNGRLFWGMPYCGWCGKKIINESGRGPGIAPAVGAVISDTFLSFLDYIYPQSSHPNLSQVISVLTKPNDAIVNEEEIDPVELKRLLKDIDRYIPVTAYVKANR